MFGGAGVHLIPDVPGEPRQEPAVKMCVDIPLEERGKWAPLLLTMFGSAAGFPHVANHSNNGDDKKRKRVDLMPVALVVEGVSRKSVEPLDMLAYVAGVRARQDLEGICPGCSGLVKCGARLPSLLPVPSTVLREHCKMYHDKQWQIFESAQPGDFITDAIIRKASREGTAESLVALCAGMMLERSLMQFAWVMPVHRDKESTLVRNIMSYLDQWLDFMKEDRGNDRERLVIIKNQVKSRVKSLREEHLGRGAEVARTAITGIRQLMGDLCIDMRRPSGMTKETMESIATRVQACIHKATKSGDAFSATFARMLAVRLLTLDRVIS